MCSTFWKREAVSSGKGSTDHWCNSRHFWAKCSAIQKGLAMFLHLTVHEYLNIRAVLVKRWLPAQPVV